MGEAGAALIVGRAILEGTAKAPFEEQWVCKLFCGHREELEAAQAKVLGLPPPETFESATLGLDGQLLLAKQMFDTLGDFIGPVLPESPLFPEPFGTMIELLLNPPHLPGDPCLAPAPLLRDILDIALGRIDGGLNKIFGKVGATVEGLMLPSFGGAEDLAKSVQAVLDDPITAALNMILGQRARIDCEVGGSLSVGAGVIQTGIERIQKEIAELLA